MKLTVTYGGKASDMNAQVFEADRPDDIILDSYG